MKKTYNRIANLPPKKQMLVILPRGRIPPFNQRHDGDDDGSRNIFDLMKQKQREPRVKKSCKILNHLKYSD